MNQIEREIIFQEERELEQKSSANQNKHRDGVHDDVCNQPREPERKILILLINCCADPIGKTYS